MNEQAVELASILTDRIHSTLSTSRILVGLAGVPASGKSTIARMIVDRVNQAFRDTSSADEAGSKDVAILIGLDGWHLTRAALDAFSDPKTAHDRRGAHWTFDGESYVEFVQAVRQPHVSPSSGEAGKSDIIYAPSFDHALKDPSPRAVAIYPHHRLVLIEGLYTFLGIPPWRIAAELLDERWWLDIGEEEAERRLVGRHVQTGVAKDLNEAIWRSRENDAPNGRFIRQHMLEPTRIIKSVDDLVLMTT